MRDQILALMINFPSDMRDMLKRILLHNSLIYQAMLQIQRNTARSPTGLLESNIKFEDALGEVMQLPYAYFRYWEVSQHFVSNYGCVLEKLIDNFASAI